MPKYEYPRDHPVAVAVEPLRKAAEERARQYAGAFVLEVRQALEASGWDAQTVAPYPSWTRPTSKEHRYYSAVRQITTAANPATYRHSSRDPEIVRMHQPGIDQFTRHAVEAAEASYVAYVHKLIHKVGQDGTVVAATLRSLGGDLWWRSQLDVLLEDGTARRWLTKTIVNRSPLGLQFNQWPTTRME